MRRFALLGCCVAAAMVLGAAIRADAQKAVKAAPGVNVRAENPLPIARPDEVLSLSWSTLRQRLPALDPARVRAVDAGSGAQLPVQVIDEDGNGQPDALLVLADFWPGQVRQLTVEAVAPDAPAKGRAYARHIDERDDIAWESDRIAYRIYGQGLWKVEPLHSSGIDVWPKRTRDLIVDRWYAKGHDLYHKDVGEGADFYTVGTSLGAGGDGIWKDGKVYWPDNFKSWKVLANGPIRAIFELTYDPFDASGVKYTETRRFVMDAGQNLYREESTFRPVDAAAPGQPLTYAIGFVKHAEGQVGSTSRAAGGRSWLSTWGPLEKKDGGHGDLGLAVLLDTPSLLNVQETDTHIMAIARAEPGRPIVHYIGAGWTASGDFVGAADWWRHLDNLAQRLASPIKVTMATVTASAR